MGTLVRRIIFGAGEFAFELITGLLKFAHALAHAAGEGGEFLGAEEDKDEDADDHHFRRSHVEMRADAHRLVGTLSYGHQRYVEIARALAGNPETLLLDEPAAGLNMTEKVELGHLLRRLKGHGLTILIIDHDMNLVEQVADHITVLNFGRRIADGAPSDVLSHPDVIAAYLGEPRRQDEEVA